MISAIVHPFLAGTAAMCSSKKLVTSAVPRLDSIHSAISGVTRRDRLCVEAKMRRCHTRACRAQAQRFCAVVMV